MATTIGNLTEQQTRAQADLKEIENASGNSRKQQRLYGDTLVESDLITMDSTNYTINATPLEIQSAPGNANCLLIPVAVAFDLDYDTAAFDIGANGMDLCYSTDLATPLLTISQANVNNASDLTRVFQCNAAATAVKNDSLVWYAPDGDLTAGGGALYTRVLFSIQAMR